MSSSEKSSTRFFGYRLRNTIKWIFTGSHQNISTQPSYGLRLGTPKLEVSAVGILTTDDTFKDTTSLETKQICFPFVQENGGGPKAKVFGTLSKSPVNSTYTFHPINLYLKSAGVRVAWVRCVFLQETWSLKT